VQISLEEKRGLGFEKFFEASAPVSSPVLEPGTGDLLVTAGSDILRIKDGKQQVYAKTAGHPNGIAFDKSGAAYICDQAHKAILTITEEGLSKVVQQFDERPLLGPNTAVVDESNSLFFTDSGPFGDTTLAEPKGSLYLVSAVGRGALLQPIVHQALAHPSGVCLSPDQKLLYVCETMRNRVLRAVQRPAGVWHVSVFYQFAGGVGPVACATDDAGNLFVARQDFAISAGARGVISIVSDQGRLLAEVPTPAPEITGLLVGPKSASYLFVTEASTKSIYRLRLSELPIV